MFFSTGDNNANQNVIRPGSIVDPAVTEAKDREMKDLIGLIDFNLDDDRDKLISLIKGSSSTWLRAWKRHQKLSEPELQVFNGNKLNVLQNS